MTKKASASLFHSAVQILAAVSAVFLFLFSTQAQSTETLVDIQVGTSIPFVSFSASAALNLDANSNLVSMTVSGNIPSMKTQTIPLKNYSSGTEYSFSGAKGPAFGIKFDSNFTVTSGGNVSVWALLCSGEHTQQAMSLVRISTTQWQLQAVSTPVTEVDLTANVTLGGQWSGCFDSANLTGQ